MIRELPPRPENKQTTRIVRVMVASAAGLAVLLSSAVPAQADELDDRRAELNSMIVDQAEALEHASGELTSANAALEAARDELQSAEAELEIAENARLEAQAEDEKRATELAAAEHKLKQAEADVAAAQAALDSVEARTSEEIIVITQQSGPLVNLAILVTDVTAADLNQRAQLSTTLFDSSAKQLDELQERRLALDAAKVAADEARAEAVAAREAAARQLADSVEKEAQADALRAVVADKLSARDAAAAEAASQLEAEEARQAQLETESADVDKRIAERIAAQKAAEEAARKKAAEEAAARKAAEEAAARKAAEEAAARKTAAARSAANSAKKTSSAAKQSAPVAKKQSAPAAKKQSAPAAKKKPAAVASSSGFQRPVSGRLSSAYGMRLHPVLGYRKLHDGTDFAASCGTPLKAAAAGTVAERYFNAGYGNRLMIDHGRIGGKYVTTGYNHATRYVVSVGQKVSKGQTIGYVGTTGYSTGCHLHLMVWENGSTVNPMSKWFR